MTDSRCSPGTELADRIDDANLPAIDIYKTIIRVDPGYYVLMPADMRDEVVQALRGLAQPALDRKTLDELIQRHASAYVARGGAISDSIIAECKASREALLAALSMSSSDHIGKYAADYSPVTPEEIKDDPDLVELYANSRPVEVPPAAPDSGWLAPALDAAAARAAEMPGWMTRGASTPSPVAGEWRPIETAPRDGTPIEACNTRHPSHAPVVVRWNAAGFSDVLPDPYWCDAATADGSALYFNENFFDFWKPTTALPASSMSSTHSVSPEADADGLEEIIADLRREKLDLKYRLDFMESKFGKIDWDAPMSPADGGPARD